MVRVFDRGINDNVNDEGKKIIVDLFYNETNNTLIDRVTDSELNFDDKFINGQLQDKQLKRLAMDQGFWFEWAAFHPETSIFYKIDTLIDISINPSGVEPSISRILSNSI